MIVATKGFESKHDFLIHCVNQDYHDVKIQWLHSDCSHGIYWLKKCFWWFPISKDSSFLRKCTPANQLPLRWMGMLRDGFFQVSHTSLWQTAESLYVCITFCTKNVCIVMSSWWKLNEDTGRFPVILVSEGTEEQIPLSWVRMCSCVCVCLLIFRTGKAMSHCL